MLLPFSAAVRRCWMAEVLHPDEISRRVAGMDGWQVEGKELACEFKFTSYLAGAAFVSDVAQVAEAANHHPDLYLGWRKVTVRLSTHSKGGITELDFQLAERISQLFGASGS